MQTPTAMPEGFPKAETARVGKLAVQSETY